jgi:hypothetical protein
MTLDELGTYLAANISGATALTLGTNLFLGRLPETPDTCVAIYETGGTVPSHTMGGASAPVVERSRVQIVVRSGNYSAGRTLAGDIWDTLEGIADEALTGVRYFRVTAVQSPFPLERDTTDRIIFTQNFDVLKEP